MLEKEAMWSSAPVANELLVAQPAIAYPCRGPFNRYTGCVGGRRCRAMNVPQCILGRWPDERTASTVVEVEMEVLPLPPTRSAPPSLPPVPVVAAAPVPAAASTPASHPASGSRVPAGARQRHLIGVAHADRNVWQYMSRQLTAAGYDPIWLSTVATAIAALDSPSLPSALLVDPRLEKQAEMSLTTLRTSRAPVLQLPVALRERTAIDRTTRMALVWLAVQLQHDKATPATA